MRKAVFGGALVCVLLLGIGDCLRAQATGSGSLPGTVKDPAGAVVPGADVTLISEGTRDERRAVTDEEGGILLRCFTPRDVHVACGASWVQDL